MADLIGADLEAVAADVRDALRRSLKPAARERLQDNAFTAELDALTDAAAALVFCLDRRDGTSSWAAALSIRAADYFHAMSAAEAAVSAKAAVEHAAGPRLPESLAELKYLAWREGKLDGN
jgi:hypothetical protein